jgi:hypothetical protein
LNWKVKRAKSLLCQKPSLMTRRVFTNIWMLWRQNAPFRYKKLSIEFCSYEKIGRL